jgi:hypothetical protein
LYLIPFSQIVTPAEDETNADLLDGKWAAGEEYKFSNYRMLPTPG